MFQIVMALTGGKKGDIGDKTSAEIEAEVSFEFEALSRCQMFKEALERGFGLGL